MSQFLEEELPLKLRPEEIRQMGEVLAEALIETPKTIMDYEAAYRVVCYESYIETLDLDLLASSTAGIFDPLGQLRDWLVSTLETVKNLIIGGITAWIDELWLYTIKPTIDSLWSVFIEPALAGISSIVTGVQSWIREVVTPAIMEAITFVADWFPHIAEFFTVTLPDFFTRVLPSYLANIASFFTETLPGYFGMVANFFTETFPAITVGIVDFFAVTLPGLFEQIAQGVTRFINFLVGLPEKAPEIFLGIVSTVWENLVEPLTSTLYTQFVVPFIQGVGDIVDKISAGFSELGRVTMGFVNAILNFPQWFPVWFESYISGPIVSFFAQLPFMPQLTTFMENVPAGVTSVVEQVWRGVSDASVWLLDQLRPFFEGVLEKLVGFGQALVGVLFEQAKKGYGALVEFSQKFKDFFEGVVRDHVPRLLEPVIGPITDISGKIGKELGQVGLLETLIKDWQDEIKEGVGWFSTFSIAFVLGYALMGILATGVRSLSYLIYQHRHEIAANLAPLGIGGALAGTFLLHLGPALRTWADEVEDWIKTLFTGLIYGFAIWVSQPLSRFISYRFRNLLPIQLPQEPQILEFARRTLNYKYEELKPTGLYTRTLELARYYMSLIGYSDESLRWFFSHAKEDWIEVKDRFERTRTFPVSLVHELPTPTDFARWMVRDLFGWGNVGLDSFIKAMQMRGMPQHVAYMYYLYHFRYPPPEKLWTFTVRGISGLLWCPWSGIEEAEAKQEMQRVGAFEPKSPAKLMETWKTDPIGINTKLFNAFRMYMKWHDYTRFAWVKDFTSDNAIIIDTVADIPTKIDQRWICVPPDTMILGDDKPIIEYKEGDHAIYGGKVLETFKRPYKGQLITIKATGLLPLKVTHEHPILVVTGECYAKRFIENGKAIARRRFKYGEPYFKPAHEIRIRPTSAIERRNYGDYLVVPRLKGIYDTKELSIEKFIKRRDAKIRKIPLNEDIAFLLGLYVAEGSTTDRWIAISLSSEEKALIEKTRRIIGKIGYSSWISKPQPSEIQISFGHTTIAKAFEEWCGKGAKNKKIPKFILLHKDEKILKAFLHGYLAGDGYFNKTKRFWESPTASKVLAMQLQLLCFRLGFAANIRAQKHKVNIIREHKINTSAAYKVTIFDRETGHRELRFFRDYVLAPIKKMSYEEYDGHVYNLETENNTYLVSNAIVHNCKWGLYELLSERGVGLTSPVSEFRTRIVEDLAKSEVKMDLVNFCRTLQATGLHPDWVPVTAVGEAMNALTEERTLLRTGFLNLFKEGFWNVEALEVLLKGFVMASFQVSYFDSTERRWGTGWVNQPVMFLPAERKLLELRALMDRALDILRDIARDVARGYSEWIVEDYEEYKDKLTQVISHINKFYTQDYKAITGVELPEGLKLKFVEGYYKPYVEGLGVYREIFTIRRVRYWTQRWLGYVMYRMATGVVEKEDIEELVSYIGEKAKLTPYEIEFIREVMELMAGIAVRDYIPTPSMLATLSEYVVIPDEYVEQAFKERDVPQKWRDLWRDYIDARPVADDIKSLLTAWRRLLVYGKVPKELEQKVKEYAAKINFTEEEWKILELRATLEEMVRFGREYVPPLSALVAFAEYVVIKEELIEKVFEVRRIPEEWRAVWKSYISARTVADDVRGLLTSYRRALLYVEIPENMKKTVEQFAGIIGFTQREWNILHLRVQLEELVREAIENKREYLPTPSMLAAIGSYVAVPEDLIEAAFDARRVPKEWRDIWARYIRARMLYDERRQFLRLFRTAGRLGIIPPEVLEELDGFARNVEEALYFTTAHRALLSAIVLLENLIFEYRENKREYVPTPTMLATIVEYVPGARGFFDKVMEARRVPAEWRPIWADYIDLRPIISEIRRYLARAEDLYVYFAIPKEVYEKVLEEAKKVGYTDKEIALMLTSANYERYLRAWRELVGDPDKLTTLAEYSPKARELAVGQLEKMIDALPIEEDKKAFIKQMWREYIRIRPVMDEVRRYITELMADFVEGIITEAEYVNELQALKEWGLDDYEVDFYKAIGGLRKARYLARKARAS